MSADQYGILFYVGMFIRKSCYFLLLFVLVLFADSCATAQYTTEPPGQTRGEPSENSTDIISQEWDRYAEISQVSGTPEAIWNVFSELLSENEHVKIYWDIAVTAPTLLTQEHGDINKIVTIHDPKRGNAAKRLLAFDEAHLVEVMDPLKADVTIHVDYSVTAARGGRQTMIIMDDVYYTLEQLGTSILIFYSKSIFLRYRCE